MPVKSKGTLSNFNLYLYVAIVSKSGYLQQNFDTTMYLNKEMKV